jgi:hypothetical protein
MPHDLCSAACVRPSVERARALRSHGLNAWKNQCRQTMSRPEGERNSLPDGVTGPAKPRNSAPPSYPESSLVGLAAARGPLSGLPRVARARERLAPCSLFPLPILPDSSASGDDASHRGVWTRIGCKYKRVRVTRAADNLIGNLGAGTDGSRQRKQGSSSFGVVVFHFRQ